MGQKRIKYVYQLAKLANIPLGTCRQYVLYRKLGIRNLRVCGLISLADLLGVTPGHLLDKTLEEEGYVSPEKRALELGNGVDPKQSIKQLEQSITRLFEAVTNARSEKYSDREQVVTYAYEALKAVPTYAEITSKKYRTNDVDDAIFAMGQAMEIATRWDSRSQGPGEQARQQIRIVTAYFARYKADSQ